MTRAGPTFEAAPRRRRWLLPALTAGLTVAAVVFVFSYFAPHTLFFDDEVDEAVPVAAGVDDDQLGPDVQMADAMPGSDGGAPEPDVVSAGSFTDRSHPASGVAKVLELSDGRRFLRIEDLRTDNGPDLFVYLSAADVDADAEELEEDYVNLGRLKGNIGNQNYEIPAGVDVGRLHTVFIWCDRFSVVFGAASLA